MKPKPPTLAIAPREEWGPGPAGIAIALFVLTSL
jgi:hypothetical protein